MSFKAPSDYQARIIWIALTALAVAVIITVIAGIIWGLGRVLNLLSPVLWPLAIAVVLAYLLDPPVNWLERRKVPRPWAIVIVFVAMLCLAGGILASIAPQLVEETNKLVSKIPAYAIRAQQQVEKWTANADKTARNTQATPFATNGPSAQPASPAAAPASTNSASGTSLQPAGALNNETILDSAKNWLKQAIPKVGGWFLNLLGRIKSLVDLLFAAILIPVYTFYFLWEKKNIQRRWTNYLPIRDSSLKHELVFILSAVNQYLIAFLRGQVIVAFISGVLYAIGFLCIGLDYALLLGLLAVILVIIPFVGAIVLGITTIVFTVVQFHDFFHPLMIVVLFTAVQSLESFFYAPRIMGNRVGLHPVVVIIALMCGITLMGGVLGGILAIPIAAALRVLMFRYIWKKTELNDG